MFFTSKVACAVSSIGQTHSSGDLDRVAAQIIGF
jgi:hypothetical protein